MACVKPITAYLGAAGQVVFTKREGSGRPLSLPCGRCITCRIDRSRAWALRMVHEAQMHQESSFITLTYDSDHIPEDWSVDVEEWKRFAKRLRKRAPVCCAKDPWRGKRAESGCGRDGKSFRFFHCGEYGDQNLRPHYHALLFGLDFSSDRVVHRRTRHGPLYRSDTLDAAWGRGFALIGDVCFETAAYVSRYVLKKRTGVEADVYERCDPETGEVWKVKPEYSSMSRRPGLGQKWFEKFGRDVFPSDEVVHMGRKFRPPRFYDEQLERRESELLEAIKLKRQRAVARRQAELAPARLRARELVTSARQSLYKRDV